MAHRREKKKARTGLGNIHFSTGNVEWSTPDDLFGELNQTFHFDLDACASPANAKCPRYFTKEQDALRQSWHGTVWMNPPYGDEIGAFMQKAYEESLAGATVVCLVPSRTDTRWWHGYAKRGQISFLRGRVKFGGGRTSAPFPSAIVIFFGGRLGDATRT
jgi:phage N-6-adenine-methyltransferase